MLNLSQNIVFSENYLRDISLKNIKTIRLSARKYLLPPPDITVSEWADRNRYLPEESIKPGRWRTDNAPHLQSIMNAVNNPIVHEITIMKSSQIGGTEAINNIIGYKIDVQPCNIAYMLPTDTDAKDYAKDKFDKMINSSPPLRRKVKNIKKLSSTEKESTLKKRYPGGRIRIFGGTSTSGTRQRSEKITIADDCDQLKIGQQSEGDPVFRLERRSATYPDYINIRISTPTRSKESRISAFYDKSNMQKYFVTCPHCKSDFYFKHERLQWEKELDAFGKVIRDFPATAFYPCDNCGAVLTEKDRMEMLHNGKWIAERHEIKDHSGFWINELSSTLSSFERVAKEIIKAGENAE